LESWHGHSNDHYILNKLIITVNQGFYETYVHIGVWNLEFKNQAKWLAVKGK